MFISWVSRTTKKLAAFDIANNGYLDNKASHFFVAQYWADALVKGANAELVAKFAPVAAELLSVESKSSKHRWLL